MLRPQAELPRIAGREGVPVTNPLSCEALIDSELATYDCTRKHSALFRPGAFVN